MTRNILVQEVDGDTITIDGPVSWPKVFIYRFLVKTYGRCIARTENGWKFQKATVIVEGAEPVIMWRLI
jgi:hypothetical protein